jgi:hypothetical protein
MKENKVLKNNEKDEKILAQIESISKISYEQHLENNKFLVMKCIEYMQNIPVILTITTLILTTISKNVDANKNMIVLYIMISLPFLIGISFALFGQKLQDVQVFPSGNEFIEIMKNAKSNNVLVEISNDIIKYYSQCGDSLKNNNIKIARALEIANFCYYIGIITILESIIFVIFL